MFYSMSTDKLVLHFVRLKPETLPSFILSSIGELKIPQGLNKSDYHPICHLKTEKPSTLTENIDHRNGKLPALI